MPATIFVTAYDQYALAAFDANALDYLLKPFGKVRFDRALNRARQRIAGDADHEMMQRFMRSMESMAGQKNYVDRLPVTDNGRITFVKTRDIQWIESAGNYARLHVASRHHDIRETLTNLESKLSPSEANFCGYIGRPSSICVSPWTSWHASIALSIAWRATPGSKRIAG